MAVTTTIKGNKVTVGDSVHLLLKIIEAGKERTQPFDGLVLSIKGRAGQKMVTVRKLATGGVGVEKIFPTESPWIAKVEVRKKAPPLHAAKLYYLRKKGREGGN